MTRHGAGSTNRSPVPFRETGRDPLPGGRIILRGRIHAAEGELRDGAVAVSGAEISYVGPAEALPPGEADTVVDVPAGQRVIPGLVDLHCHGAFGVDFPTAHEADARRAAAGIHAAGTTTLLASLVTAPAQDLLGGLDVLSRIAADGGIAGIHVEGPFLSPARCGAQDPRWLLEPDLGLARELLAGGRGFLRSMTYAPELPGAEGLVELLASHGVVPSLGHTAAETAVAAGSLRHARAALARRSEGPAVPTVTHLFNGMEPLHHRSPGAVSACLRAARAGEAVVELIADNIHLHPDLVVTMFELLGADNIALVTDSMAAAGLSDGVYSLGPAEVRVHAGVARLGSGAIAGGTASMMDVLRNAVEAGVPFDQALRSATVVPARTIGLADSVGTLAHGTFADLVIIDEALAITGVMRRGRWLARH
jgi:N-acetylglucosamine-6-phosphate deacetylase